MNDSKLIVFLISLLATGSQVMACPDCALKSSGGLIEPLTMVSKVAFSNSTLFMLGTFLTVLGFMIWVMVKACREAAAQSKEHPLSSNAFTSPGGVL